MQFEDFMYFLPAILIGIIFIGRSIVESGFDAIIFWLFVLGTFLFLYFWGKYWLNKKNRRKDENNM